MQHLHKTDMESPHENDKKRKTQLRKKCDDFFSAMMRTASNTPIWLEGDGVVLWYDHIVPYMNSNQEVVKVNS